MYHKLFPIKRWIQKEEVSERSLAKTINLSRVSLRELFKNKENFNFNTLLKVANHFEQDIAIVSFSSSKQIIHSTVSTAYLIQKDGFDSWKIHLMNMVDEFRSSLDMRILLLPPPQEIDVRLKSLIASVASYLCEEAMVAPPTWTQKSYYLSEPWFISEIEGLKAFALLESPLQFRKNNIFVLNNFLQRA